MRAPAGAAASLGGEMREYEGCFEEGREPLTLGEVSAQHAEHLQMAFEEERPSQHVLQEMRRVVPTRPERADNRTSRGAGMVPSKSAQLAACKPAPARLSLQRAAQRRFPRLAPAGALRGGDGGTSPRTKEHSPVSAVRAVGRWCRPGSVQAVPPGSLPCCSCGSRGPVLAR